MSMLLLMDDDRPPFPRSLFSAGEQGVWYDPSDFSTLFQDAAGTTPVTAPGQSVGLMLDKSKGLVLGPELIVNGAFDDSSAWTASNTGTGTATIASGALTLTGTDASNRGRSYQAFTTVVGKSYKATWVNSGAYSSVFVGTAIGGSGVLAVAGSAQTGIFTATSTTTYVTLLTTSAGGSTVFDNISIRELPGNHATQSTDLSRPTLQQDSNGMYYLSFDGTDDWMIAGAASTFNFLHNNLGATVFCGYMPSGTSVYHAIAATGNLGSPVSVGFTLGQDDRTLGITYNIIANGSGTLFVNGNPITGVTASKRVVSVVNASGKHITRKNAVQISAATETGSASLANSTYGLSIGRTGAGLTPLNGRIYQLIVRGAASNDGQIAAGEAWCNSKTRAY